MLLQRLLCAGGQHTLPVQGQILNSLGFAGHTVTAAAALLL